MPDFNNVENESILADGRQFWISRSVAVVAVPVFRLLDGSLNVPVGVRSSKTPDHQGKPGLVCGYLDWNESGYEAVKRECWEEIGLDLDRCLPNIKSMQPYFVQSDPAQDERQNVTLRYRFLIDVEILPILKASSEVDRVFYTSDDPRFWQYEESSFAFNHYDLIRDTFKHFKSSQP